jgi:hypothetical protein
MEAVFADACKVAVELLRRGGRVETWDGEGHAIVIVGGKCAASVECSDWIDDGRISVYSQCDLQMAKTYVLQGRAGADFHRLMHG